MRSSLRPTTIDDLGRICELLRRAFHSAADAPFLAPSVMKWKYWDRRDDWEEPRAYVTERNGVITAHVGVYPMTLQGLRGVQMIDWASSDESPGAGVALLQKLQAMFDFVYSIGGSEMTRRILPAVGFVEHTQQWRGVRPLRPIRQTLKHQHRNWKLAPRLVRNLVWATPKTPAKGLLEEWTAEEIDPEEFRGNPSWPAAVSDCCSPRPPAFFEYLRRCPVMPVRICRVRNGREPRGHFAIGILRGQARVAGVWLYDSDEAAWRAVFALARLEAAQTDEACEIVAAGTQGSTEQAAIRAGFRIVRRLPVYLLNPRRNLTLPENFQFQLCDDDTFFGDSGESSFWS